MKNKKLLLVPFIAVGLHGCKDDKPMANSNTYIRTSADSTYKPYGNHRTHIFYPLFFMAAGHYFHGGYDSPTARSYFSGTDRGRSMNVRSGSFHTSAHSAPVVMSRGGFGRSGFHSSAT